MPVDPEALRVGTKEREEALQALGDHFAEGRLPVDEYDQRVTLALESQTRADIRPLFADLPPPHPSFMATPKPFTPPPPPQPVVGGYMPAPLYRENSEVALPSDRYRVVAGVLQIVLPFGIGRFYTGHNQVALAQLLTMFIGVGVIWCIVDGIMLLAKGGLDANGRQLRG
jgi:TM2 domain-containing membrane protein YozV